MGITESIKCKCGEEMVLEKTDDPLVMRYVCPKCEVEDENER